MPTVIDSLILELKLDPSNFTKGQKEAASAFLKTKDQAVSTGKVIEESGKRAAEAVNKVKNEALALFAVLMGARGVKEFFGDMTTANAELDRFSRNLAESPQRVSGWSAAVERMGGSADTFRGTMEHVGRALFDFHNSGKSLPSEFYRLQSLAGMNIETGRGIDKFLQDTATALQRLNAINPSQAHFLAQGMGIDDATANVMFKYGAAVTSYADQLGKALGPTGNMIRQSQELQAAWAGLQQEASHLGNVILSGLTPVLTPLLKQMADWIDVNQDWLSSKISEDVGELADYLKSVDWKAVGQGIRDFAAGADDAAKAIGGWQAAAETLFGLWVGAKFLQVLSNVRMLAAATGSGQASGGGESSGSGGALSRMAPFAAGLLGVVANAPSADASGDAAREKNYGAISSLGSAISKALGLDYLKEKLHGEDEVKVDGRDVSKANPLPVTAIGAGQSATGRGIGGSTGSGLGGGDGTSPAGGGNPSLPSGTGTGGASSATVRTAMNVAMDQLRKEGVPESSLKYAAAALVGNAIGESQLNPTLQHDKDPRTGQYTGYGIYGARLVRRDNMFSWLSQNGYDKNSLEGQMRQMAHSAMTDPSYSATRAALMYANKESVGGATITTRKNFEGPSVPRDDARLGGAAAGLRSLDTTDAEGAGGTPRNFGATGASGAAAMHHNDNRISTSQTSHEVNIGSVTVNAPNATDADGVAQGMKGAVGRSFLASGSNYGLR